MESAKKIKILLSLLGFSGIIYLNSNRYLLKNLFSAKKIHVKIENGVKNPGIYQMQEGNSLQELIDMAGGLDNQFSLPENYEERILLNGEIIRLGVRND